MTKTYKHKRLGWIAKYMEQDGDMVYGRYYINDDEHDTVRRELIEDSDDWEEIIQKDWIDKAEKYLIVEYGWSINSNDAKKEFRTAIEKYMPRISEEELENTSKETINGKGYYLLERDVIELLKSKGLLKDK